MTQSSLLITVGIITVLAPFLGLPFSVLDVLIPILGLVVFGIGLKNRLHDIRTRQPQNPSQNAIL